MKIPEGDHDWYRARLKDKFLRLPAGRIVAVARTKLRHSMGGAGPTFWLLSPEDEVLYQVAEHGFGSSLSQLVRVERRVKDDEVCRAFALKLSEGGQYSRERRHEIKHILPKGGTERKRSNSKAKTASPRRRS